MRPFSSALARSRSAHAAAVVGHDHDDVIALLARFEAHDALHRLAGGQRSGRPLDAVIDGVADEVDDRVGEILDHRLVDLGLFADQRQLDVLAEVAGEVAGNARVLLEQAADRLHARLHHRVLQVGDQQVELAHRLVERLQRLGVGAPARMSLRRLVSRFLVRPISPDRLSTWSRRAVSTRIELSRCRLFALAPADRRRRRRACRWRGGRRRRNAMHPGRALPSAAAGGWTGGGAGGRPTRQSGPAGALPVTACTGMPVGPARPRQDDPGGAPRRLGGLRPVRLATGSPGEAQAQRFEQVGRAPARLPPLRPRSPNMSRTAPASPP
jgi:hypothetical protein